MTRESGYTAIIIVAVIGLSGCMQNGRALETVGGESGYVRVWTDAETGCDYITVAGYPESIMPRVSADGFTVLCADQKARQAISAATGQQETES